MAVLTSVPPYLLGELLSNYTATRREV